MDESILATIKGMLPIEEDNDAFDVELIAHINGALMILTQLGIGPEEGFSIDDSGDQTWGDLIGERGDLEGVKDFIYTKVKPIFDPSTSTTVMQALKEASKEYEWRLSIQAD